MLRTLALALALVSLALPARAQEWQPSAQQQTQARAAADAYWTAGDRGDAAAAYTMIGPGLRQMMTEAELTANLQRFMALAGPLVERRVARTSWYKDPPNAAGPGVYAAFDIVARYANIDRYCGYAIVYQRNDGDPFVILRIEQNYIDNATAVQIAEQGGSVEDFWLRLAHTSCPGWDPSWAIPIPPPAPPPS